MGRFSEKTPEENEHPLRLFPRDHLLISDDARYPREIPFCLEPVAKRDPGALTRDSP